MTVLAGLDPVWQAQNHLRGRQYEECINLCSELLAKHPYDQVEHALLPLRSHPRVHTAVLEQCSQAVWYLKTRALTLQDWIDDTEVEEEVRASDQKT